MHAETIYSRTNLSELQNLLHLRNGVIEDVIKYIESG